MTVTKIVAVWVVEKYNDLKFRHGMIHKWHGFIIVMSSLISRT